MNIIVGLGGWGDHDALYPSSTKSGDKLSIYCKHFRMVEIDSTFYAIQSADRMKKWMEDTPKDFKFIVKAYQGMTGHQRGSLGIGHKRDEMYEAFIAMLQPLIEEDRLAAVLFQFPPWFDCMTKHVMVLRATKKRMGELPCTLEFRHQSWWTEEMREKTLAFMRNEGWMHSICDEPQAGEGSVPMVLEATHPQLTMVRMHGRNVEGWNDTGDEHWREVRYLYQYNETELVEWIPRLMKLAEHSEQIYIVFNNNSGGHAAMNAKQMMELLGQVTPEGKQPLKAFPDVIRQLELF